MANVEIAQLAAELGKAIGAWIGGSHYRRAAGDAGELSFFQTGMLASLRKIADGQGTAADQDRLRHELGATETGVNEVIERLRTTRDKLAGEARSVEFAHFIDDILYGPFGKTGIRQDISQVISADLGNPYTPAMARRICNDIEAFNRAVIDLGQRATNWGRE